MLVLYIVLLGAVVLIMGLSQNCRHKLEPPVDGFSGRDTLDVAIIYGPLSYYMYGDTLGGINYDLLRIYEKQCSIPVKFWPVVDIKESFNKLESGAFDMLASVTADYSIRKKFLTTESVFLDRLVLVQLEGNPKHKLVTSALDLAKDTIYIAEGSPADSRLENLSHEIGEQINIVALKNMSDEYLCIKVAKGELPLAVVNEKTAMALQKTYPNLSFMNPVSFTQFQSWLLPLKEKDKFNKVNNWLKDFKTTDNYREIINKYSETTNGTDSIEQPINQI